MTDNMLEIQLGHTSYRIYIERNILKKVANYIKEEKALQPHKIAIITDDNLVQLYAQELAAQLETNGFEVCLISVAAGEQSKSMETLSTVYEKLAAFRISRTDLILTLGGGVVGDLGGFAAATFLRGVPFIQLPTSLLAQVDSSIGGKVAVDLPSGKNLVGSFYHPYAVFIDPELLRTLDSRFLHDGLAEVIKYGCIRSCAIIEKLEAIEGDEQLLECIEGFIYECCSIKKVIVEKDEKDLGERMLLNFGHTIGHAIEKYFDFEKFTHGEAVAIGMAMITKASERLGLTDEGTFKRLVGILEKYQLPSTAGELTVKSLLDTIALDKKTSSGSMHLILIDRIGEGRIQTTPLDQVSAFVGL